MPSRPASRSGHGPMRSQGFRGSTGDETSAPAPNSRDERASRGSACAAPACAPRLVWLERSLANEAQQFRVAHQFRMTLTPKLKSRLWMQVDHAQLLLGVGVPSLRRARLPSVARRSRGRSPDASRESRDNHEQSRKPSLHLGLRPAGSHDVRVRAVCALRDGCLGEEAGHASTLRRCRGRLKSGTPYSLVAIPGGGGSSPRSTVRTSCARELMPSFT